MSRKARDKYDEVSIRIREKRRRDRELNKNSFIEDSSVFKGRTLPGRFNTESSFSQNMIDDTTVVSVSFDDCFPCLPQPDDEASGADDEMTDAQRAAALDMQPKLTGIANAPVNPMTFNTEVSTKRYGKTTEIGKFRVENTVASTDPQSPTGVIPVAKLKFDNPVGS